MFTRKTNKIKRLVIAFIIMLSMVIPVLPFINITPAYATTNEYCVTNQVFISNGTGVITEVGRQANSGTTVLHVTTQGNFTFRMANATSANVTSGTATVTGSPKVLTAGSNTVTVTGTGTINLIIKYGTTALYGDTNTWASSSGGACGAGVPSSTVNVYFDANSFPTTGTSISIASSTRSCNDMDWTGATNNPILSGTSGLQISGSLTFISSMSRTTYTGAITFLSTTNSNVNFSGSINSSIFFNGIGGNWTLQSDLTTGNVSGKTVTLSKGILNTNNKNISCYQFSMGSSGNRTVNLGSSNINVIRWITSPFTTGENFNAGNSTINIYQKSNISTYWCGFTYYDVNFYADNDCSFLMSDSLPTQFHNLKIIMPNHQGSKLDFNGIVNITNKLTIQGGSTYYAYAWQTGNPRTATLNASSVDISNCIMYGFNFGGSTSWDLRLSTNVGDGGYNDSLFVGSIPKTLYYSSNTGNFTDSSKWYLGSGATGGLGGRTPLPQDTTIFDNNSFTSAGATLYIDSLWVNNLDFSGVSNLPTLSFTDSDDGECFCMNDLDLNGIGVLTLNNQYIYFVGYNDISIDTNGYIMRFISFDNSCHNVILNSDIYLTAQLNIVGSNINMNGKNITCTYVSSQTYTFTGMRTLNMSSGNITVNYNNNINVINFPSTNFTINKGTSSIVVDSSAINTKTLTFSGNDYAYNNLLVKGSGNYIFKITGNNTFENITIDSSSTNKTVQFPNGGTQTVKTFNATGSATKGIRLTNTSGTSPWYLVKSTAGIISCDYLNISYSNASPATTWYAGSHSINGASNTGWVFADAPTLSLTTKTATNTYMNGGTHATLNGSIDSMGILLAVSYYFEWGYDISYGNIAGMGIAVASGNYSCNISHFDPTRIVHYRFVCSSMGTNYYGSDISFSIGSSPPYPNNPNPNAYGTYQVANNVLPLLFVAIIILVVIFWYSVESQSENPIKIIFWSSVLILVGVYALPSLISALHTLW